MIIIKKIIGTILYNSIFDIVLKSKKNKREQWSRKLLNSIPDENPPNKIFIKDIRF